MVYYISKEDVDPPTMTCQVLVISYITVVLSTNVGLVLLHVVAGTYHRSLWLISHLYIGNGQHTLLRVALGLIEITSSMFRAASLSLRVVCNATAGHVLLSVLLDMTTASGVHMIPTIEMIP